MKTPEEYEAIIRKLIFCNWAETRNYQHDKSRISINFGPFRYTWEGSSHESISAPRDYLFKKVMEDEKVKD